MVVLGKASPVQAALDKFQQAHSDRSSARGKAAAAARRRVYEGMSEVCNAYFRQTLPPLSLQNREEFPPEVAMALAIHLTNLLAGKLDKFVRELVERPGARGRTFPEQEDIDAAVRYLQAVGAGLIDDRAPVARVSEWFGVGRAAAQKWRREEKRDLLAEFWPEAGSQDRAEAITNHATRSGARYAKDGRGQKAIAGRRKKQGVI